MTGSSTTTLSAYVHVPYCKVRCGYCDFNTYTGTELRGVTQSDFVQHVRHEIRMAKSQLDARNDGRPFHSVFFGGGTPTLLPAEDLSAVLSELHESIGIEPSAEITTEANPDSVDARYLHALAKAGFTRVSFGVQSVVPHVLATLDRTHDTSRVREVVSTARAEGLSVSVDLIYGSPGESLDDWKASLDFVTTLGVDHISAYSLIVEPGTAMERKIRSGQIPEPDLDLQADMYVLADEAFSAAGFSWYEVSNWSVSAETRSSHNVAYWRNADWWGFGAGAHSHMGGKRWWNVKHPAAYAERVVHNHLPELGHEYPTTDQQYLEFVMLNMRTREGLLIADLTPVGKQQIPQLIADGLIEGKNALSGTATLTLKGRLMADQVIRRLV